MIALVLDHLWQSTLFAAGAGLLTLVLRDNSAQVRFWLWFAASVKFLIPFAALTALGRYLLVPLPLQLSALVFFLIQPAAQPFFGADVGPICARRAGIGFDGGSARAMGRGVCGDTRTVACALVPLARNPARSCRFALDGTSAGKAGTVVLRAGTHRDLAPGHLVTAGRCGASFRRRIGRHSGA